MKIILIAGASGSGKTTIAKTIQKVLCQSQSCYILSMDNYYNDLSHLSMDDRQKLDYDLPKALEWARLLVDIDILSCGEPCDIPIYDFAQHNRSDKTQTINPPNVLIIEGIHGLYNSDLRSKATSTIFVDTLKEVCLERRLRRDQRERGRNAESIKKQFDSQVWPAYEKHILPLKNEATHIISNNQDTYDIDVSAILNEFHAKPLSTSNQSLFATVQTSQKTQEPSEPKIAM